MTITNATGEIAEGIDPLLVVPVVQAAMGTALVYVLSHRGGNGVVKPSQDADNQSDDTNFRSKVHTLPTSFCFEKASMESKFKLWCYNVRWSWNVCCERLRPTSPRPTRSSHAHTLPP